MQTEVPTLPVVNSNTRKVLNRKQETSSRNTGAANKPCSPCRNSVCQTLNQKRLCPLLGGPYRSSVRLHSLPEQPKPMNKTPVCQRIMSAKMLRFKQLQNQLADAHYHLNELANENRLLKALQKRQDLALKKYEGTNAELPRIINSHHEELRVLHTKYKRLKSLHKETCDLLKEKENELQCLQSQNKHLLQLSKDRNLVEREKLQLQVSDLNHTIQQQQDNIQLLHRKLSLESKSLKQQLHLEISKHKETQKTLQETVNKLKSLESLLDNRERKLYYSGQLPVYSKAKLGTQSLTNLRDTSSNRLKSYLKDKDRTHNITQRDSLPLLNTSESNDDDKINQLTGSTNMSQSPRMYKTETMTSLDQVRRFRLQKLDHHSENTLSLEDLKQRIRQQKSHTNTNGKTTCSIDEFDPYKYVNDESNLHEHETDRDPFEKEFDSTNDHEAYKLPDELNVELGYLSDDSEILNTKHEEEDQHINNPSANSRELHARLISSAYDIPDGTKDGNLNNEQTEGQLKTLLSDPSIFSNRTPVKKSIAAKQQSSVDFFESDSETEMKKDLNDTSRIMEYKTRNIKRLSLYDPPEHQQPNPDSDSASGNEKSNISNDLKIRAEQNISSQRKALSNQKSSSINSKRENYVLEKTDSGMDNKKKEEQNVKEHPPNANTEVKEICTVLAADSKQSESVQVFGVEHTTPGISKLQLNSNDSPTNNFNKYDPPVDNQMYTLHEVVNDCDNDKGTNNKSEKTTLSEDDFGDRTELKCSINDPVNMESANVPQENDHAEQNYSTNDEVNSKNVTSQNAKLVTYNKEKLLATMKAIDDNENIEFLESPGFQKCNIMNRSQITENLFRGLPTHTKKKENLIKDIFGSSNIENKRRNSCNKLH